MKNRNYSQIKIGALITYISIGLNIVAGFIYTPWMIKQIGQSDYGIYTLANSLITLFLIDFGLGSATSRFVAKYRAENNQKRLDNFLSAVYKLYILIDAFIFIILLIIYFCIDIIYMNFTAEEIDKFKVVFCIAGLYSLVSFPCVTFNGILTAYEKFIPLKFADIIQRVGCIILTVFSLLLGLGLYALVAANAIFGIVSILFKYYFVRKNVRIKLVPNKLSVYKEIFSFSIWSTIWSLAQRLIFNITPTIIGITVASATAEIAVFGVISTIESYFYTVTTAINGMFLSRITKIILDDPLGKRLTALAIKVGRFQFALNGLITLAFFLIGKEFILLWMGKDYIDAYYGILLVVAPGIFYNSLQISNTSMIAQNLIKYQAIIQIIAGVCNVILSLIFSYFWGVIGASLSICIAYTIRLILTLVLIRKKLNLNLLEFIKKCYIKMSIPLILSCLIGLFATSFIVANSWLILCVKGIIVATIYLLSIMIIGFDKDERKKIFEKINLSKIFFKHKQ